ncbi:flagellar M-ring protein FliF C-terminal domain-containing protein, partial [Klebsiella quasipneumoniae]
SADVDFSAVESTSEQFNPDQPALRSEQSTSEQRTAANGPPQGVPGALSNQPPAPASAPQTTGGAAATAGAIQPGQPLLD